MDLFLLRRTGAECIGVFFLVLTACGSVIIGGLTGAYGHMGMAFSPGLVVIITVAATGHQSMAHLNKAVTLAFALSRHIPWREEPVYIAWQLPAAVLGAAVLRLLFGNVFALGANLPVGPILQSLVMEMLVTALLMFVILAVATDQRAKGLPAGRAIGGAIALNLLWAGPISSASMNPARSFEPVLFSGIGPLSGSTRLVRLSERLSAHSPTKSCAVPNPAVCDTAWARKSNRVLGM